MGNAAPRESKEVNGMKSIAVFCGSCFGTDPAFRSQAKRLGLLMARENIGLIYGGGDVGLMGEIANTMMGAGGHVIGIIPEALARMELANRNISELRVVSSMHERKAMMADLADAFIALPGGVGTLDEFAEIVTWAQIGFHRKPCGMLNVNRYFDHLIDFFDTAVEQRFFRPEHRSMIVIETEPEALLKGLSAYEPPPVIDRDFVTRERLSGSR